MIKLIDSLHYHLWTDALHARALACTAGNDWDRGTYVRWAVSTAWTAFETVCEDALGAPGLGYQFKERFDKAVQARRLPKVDWGSGLWQRVLLVYNLRKDYTHIRSSVDHARLFAPLTEADTAISVLREAIRGVYLLVGQTSPPWVDDDDDPGWAKAGPTMMAHSKIIRAGVDESDPDMVRIAYVYRGQECEHEVAPPGTPSGPLLDELVRALNVPASAVRAYRGDTLMEERTFYARGSELHP